MAGSSGPPQNLQKAAGAVAGDENPVERHVPQRTCIGCRKCDDQAVLLRLVLIGSDGLPAVVVDERRRMVGRGAWMHPRQACMALAVKRRAFNRAFRAPATTQDVERYFHALGEDPGPSQPQPSNLKAGQKTDGNPMSTRR